MVSFRYHRRRSSIFLFFFFNDTATTEIYTLSLHDALPISRPTTRSFGSSTICSTGRTSGRSARSTQDPVRSEEHTSELQSRLHLVCRLLLEKKKKCGAMHTYNWEGVDAHGYFLD